MQVKITRGGKLKARKGVNVPDIAPWLETWWIEIDHDTFIVFWLGSSQLFFLGFAGDYRCIVFL